MFLAVESVNMRVFGLVCFIVVSSVTGLSAQKMDVINDVSIFFEEGNTKKLSEFFSSTVSITFRQDEGVYSRVQSEIILKEFFNRNQPQDAEILHLIDTHPNFRFVVLKLSTANGSYRVSFKLVSEGNAFRMTEIRIE